MTLYTRLFYKPARTAKSVVCLGLRSGVRRPNSRVRNLSLLSVTGERVSTENRLSAYVKPAQEKCS